MSLLRCGHSLCRLAWATGLLLLCGMLYLWLIGLPGPLVERLLRQTDTHPFRVGVGRVTLDPTAGLVANGLYLYHEDDFSEPLARVRRVILQPDWAAARARTLRWSSIELEGGSLRAPAPRAFAPGTPRLAARDIQGRILLHEDRIELAPITVAAFDIRCKGTGSVMRVATTTRGIWRELEALLAQWADAPAALGDLAREVEALRFEPPLETLVGFHIHPARGEDLRVDVTARGASARVRGAAFDHVRAALRLEGVSLTLDELRLESGDLRAHMNGALDLTGRLAEAHVYSDLPPALGLAVMPAAWRDELESLRIVVDGGMRSELWVGPAPLSELDRHAHGWLALERASVRGVPLQRGFVSVRVTGDTVRLENLSAEVGRAAGRGPLEAELVWQRDTGDLDGRIRANFDPNLLRPLLTRNQRTIAARFGFPAEPPLFEGEFQVPGRDRQAATVSGRITAGASSYRGVPLTTMRAGLAYRDQRLSLNPLGVTRPEGSVSGWLDYVFDTSMVELNLEGAMDPHAVAGLVGPGLQRALARTRYEEAVHMSARGVADADHSDRRTDLWVGIAGRRMGVSNWMADTVSLDLHALGGRYTTTNAAGTAYGGNFTAVVNVAPDETGTSHVYDVTARITNAAIGLLALRLHTNAVAEGAGRLHAQATVSGPVDDPEQRRLTGWGEARVEDGELFRQPLLGGLSRLLSMIYPGLGFASQDDLQATFLIRNGQIITRDAQLAGTVLSMKAAGYYAFDGRLRFNVEVQLLRKGVLATTLRFLTMPVTKLLVFQLSGTLQEPRWRPVNLPKELFLIFD